MLASANSNDEERRLRAAALKNAESILIARQRAERELRAAEERLRATFNQAAVGIGVADLQYRIIEANQTFADMLGYTPEELRKLTFTELTHPEDLTTTMSHVRRLINGEIPHYMLQKRYIRKDGGIVWIRTTVTLLREATGEADELIAIIENISERKQVEEVRGRLAAIVTSSEDAIISKTLDGIITTWNRGAERMFGYRAEEIIGKPVPKLVPPEHRDQEAIVLERLKRGERIEHYETVRLRKDGSRLNVSLSVSPILNAEGKVIGVSKISRDITRQKRMEEALRAQIASRERAEAALRETDRRKDEFLATLAHELRNPLAPIRHAALISKARNATEAQKRWSHDVISRQVQHMALLLDDLLDISRITRGTLGLRTEMTELSAVIDAAVETARPAIEAKGHEFSTELPETPVHFAADPLRLAQVLSNLLTNAAKYTDSHGKIWLRAQVEDSVITIGVTDTGLGIPQEAFGNLFTMFSQVQSHQERAEGGLGIGLALAKGLVELHGGSIEAKSPGTGKGSEFMVRLPLREHSVCKVKEPASAKATSPCSCRVLIADDNRDAAQSMALLLQMEGHEVTVAHDGHEALRAFETVRPQVMLLDIGMPQISGYDVARRVRESPYGKTLTLIAVTGWGQDSDKARALAAGFDHHFTKPVEPERISELLRSKEL